MAAPLNTNRPSAMWECDLEERVKLNKTSNLLSKSDTAQIPDHCGTGPAENTHPRMANAGSSWRSNGKSRRKRVLKSAVMVSSGWKERRRLHCQRNIPLFNLKKKVLDKYCFSTMTNYATEWIQNTHLHWQTGREEPSWSRTSTFLLVPHCQHSEDEGAEGGGEEAPPVVPHREERWRHLNAEQHPCAANKHTTWMLLAQVENKF